MLKKAKRRYLLVTVDSSEPCTSDEFFDAVWKSILRLYGEHGCSTVILSLMSFDGEKSAILRTTHTSLELVRTALASMTRIGGKPTAVHVSKVSGTLKALRKKPRQ